MTASTRRLFFALWPDDEIRREIIARRDRLGRVSRRQVPDHNLHLTLIFLGNQPGERIAGFEAAAEAVKASASLLKLDRFGWFPGARVLWLGGDPPTGLEALHTALYKQIEALGISLERRPFRPHVTLFRKVERRPDLPEPLPLAWPVREFVLVESLPGRPYRLIGRWPLQPG